MLNSIYYIILAIASSLVLTFTLWKKRDRKLVTLYFFAAGVTYVLEYFVLVLFNGYAYYPKILNQEYFDNIMGAVVSDAFIIPMLSVFIAAFKLNFIKRSIIALIITFIEIIFVNLNIFEHFWWRSLYTFLGMNIFFYFTMKWLTKLQKPIKLNTRFITLFFSNIVIQALSVFVLVCFLNKYLYFINWFSNPYRSHVAFTTLYIIFITLIFITMIVFKLSWFWKVVGVIFTSVIDIVLVHMNILQIYDKWSLFNFLIFRIFIFTCISLFNKHLLK